MFENEFVGQKDYLYNFVKDQSIPGAGQIKIKDYLSAIYPDRLQEKSKLELYKQYLNIIKENQYKPILGMPEETIRSYSNYIKSLLYNKNNILKLTINAMAIKLITYEAFNKFSSHLEFILDAENKYLVDLKQAYKADLNVTSQTIIENKNDFINIYNIFINF